MANQDQLREYEQYAPQQAGGRLFSNAMFGFNKEEVLEYLEELADENNQRQETAQQRIEELSRKMTELEARAEAQPKMVEGGVPPAELEEAKRRVTELSSALDVSKTAARQAEEELQEFKEQVFTAQKENNWLREEYKKSDRQIADLRRQLDDASQGQWYGAEEQIIELRRQLEEVLAERDAAEAERDAAEAERDLVRVERDNMEVERDALEAERDVLEVERDNIEAERDALEAAGGYDAEETDSVMGQAAATIVAEATEEAERIRAEARAERDRVHRQVLNSAGGLANSIATLREELSSVEGDVSSVLERVQNTLAELGVSLGHTEQSLGTLGVQAERFPASSPAVLPPKNEVVYFQASEQVEPEPQPQLQQQQQPLQRPELQERRVGSRDRRAKKQRPSAPHSYGSGGFHRVWPDDEEKATAKQPRTFQPTFVTSGQTARVLEPVEDYDYDEDDDRMRALTETLVETLRQMLD